MATRLLDGLRVLDLCGESGALAGRVLADLGAEVVLAEPPGGAPLRGVGHRFDAWGAGKA
ncbi:MAG: CoA transferase, partial [Acidimicrobiales bacterium]